MENIQTVELCICWC